MPLLRTLSTCRWPEGRNEHILHLRLAILGDVCKINGLFTLLPYSAHLWSMKKPGIQTLIRWLFWGTSLPSSQSASSQLKSLPCLNLSLGFIGPSCSEQSEFGLSNTETNEMILLRNVTDTFLVLKVSYIGLSQSTHSPKMNKASVKNLNHKRSRVTLNHNFHGGD